MYADWLLNFTKWTIRDVTAYAAVVGGQPSPLYGCLVTLQYSSIYGCLRPISTGTENDKLFLWKDLVFRV